VFINFYADWCRFSNMLSPIWDEFADKAKTEFTIPGQVYIGKIDCDKEGEISRQKSFTEWCH
jgi:endoplasmic reticulum resident protein 44